LDVSGEAEPVAKPPTSESERVRAAPWLAERAALQAQVAALEAQLRLKDARQESELLDVKAQLTDALRDDPKDQKKWIIYWRKRATKAEAELGRYSVSAGLADQFKAEAQTMRVALGFEKDSEEVAPADLLEALQKRTSSGEAIRRAALDDFTVWLVHTHGLLIDARLLREFGIHEPSALTPPSGPAPSGSGAAPSRGPEA
jgi:hypothetical protein